VSEAKAKHLRVHPGAGQGTAQEAEFFFLHRVRHAAQDDVAARQFLAAHMVVDREFNPVADRF